MKKVLIYINDEDLEPTGGPKGYNYNLREGLLKLSPQIQVSYLPGNSKGAKFDKCVLNQINNQVLNSWLRRMKKYIGCLKTQYGNKHVTQVNLSEYDAVHFQSTYSMYKVRNSLKDYTGVVILQSHTPTKPSKETYDNISEQGKYKIGWSKKIFDEADEYAFNRANYIIFPCEEAEEPYFNQWDEYKNIKKKNMDKYRYLLTGTDQKIASVDKNMIRDKYGIPIDAFVVSYVGRHNEIKGYDILKKMGKSFVKWDNTYCLVAGREEPLNGIVDSNWIEVGWTNDPHSIINAADLFVLPNRETYFDLVLLEVLSLGQIVVASNTGGNKFFKSFKDSGIFLYDNIDEALSIIEKIKEMNIEEKQILQEKNKKIYKEYFSNEVFAKNYISLIGELL